MANKTAYKDVFKSITVVKNEHDLPQITKDDEVLSVRVLKKVEGGESISSNVSIDIFKEVMRVESTKFYNTIEERDADTVNLRVGNFAVVKSINNVSILYTDKTWFRINDEIKFYDTIEARDADTVNLHIGSFAVIKSINNASVLYTDRTWFRINGGTDNLLMLSQEESGRLLSFDDTTKEVSEESLPTYQKIYDAAKDNPNLIVIAPTFGVLMIGTRMNNGDGVLEIWGGWEQIYNVSSDSGKTGEGAGFIANNIAIQVDIIGDVVTKTGSIVEVSQVTVNNSDIIRLDEKEERDLVGGGSGVLTETGAKIIKKIINAKLYSKKSAILSPTYGALSVQMTDTTIKVFGSYTTDIKDGKTASNNILIVSASFTKDPTTVIIEGSKVERLALELGSVEETNRTKIYATIEERDLDTVNLKIGDFAVVKSLNNVSVLYTDRTWYRINGGIDNLLMLSQEELEHLMDFDQATKEVKEVSLPTLQKIYDVGKDNPNLIVIAPTFGAFYIEYGSSLIIRGGYEQLYGFVIEDGTMDGFIAANMEISAPIIDNVVTKTGSKFTLSQVAVNNNDTIRLDKREETALSGDGTGVLTEMGGDVIKRIVNTKLYNERVAVLSPTYGVLSTQMTDTTIKIFGSYTTDIKNGKTASNNILIVTASFTKDPTTIILEGSKVEVLVVELGNIPESNKVKFYETIEARDADVANLKNGDGAIVSKVSTSEKPLDGAMVSKLSFNTNHIPDLASYITSPDDKFEDLISCVGFGNVDDNIDDSLLVINLNLNKNLIATGSPKSAIAYRALMYLDVPTEEGVPPSYIIMYSDTDFTLTPSPDLTITGSKGWNNSTISFDTPTQVTYTTIALGATYDFVWTDIDECFASKTVVENVSVWNGTNFLSTTTPIVQTSGQSTTSVMSQKSVTDLVNSSGGLPVLDIYANSFLPRKAEDATIERVYSYFGGKDKFEAFVVDITTRGAAVYKVRQHYGGEEPIESISGICVGNMNYTTGQGNITFQHTCISGYGIPGFYYIIIRKESGEEWKYGGSSHFNTLDLYDGTYPNFLDYMAPTAAYVKAELAKKEGAPDYTSTKEISLNEYWLEYDGVTKRQVYLRTFVGVTPSEIIGVTEIILTTNGMVADAQLVCGNIGQYKNNVTIYPNILWSYRTYNGNLAIGMAENAARLRGVPYTLTFKYTKI